MYSRIHVWRHYCQVGDYFVRLGGRQLARGQWKRANAGNAFALLLGSILWSETENPELALCLDCKAAQIFRSFGGLPCRKPVQIPKQRSNRKSRDLHLGKQLTPRIARSQTILETREKPVVVCVLGGRLCLSTRRSDEGKNYNQQADNTGSFN